MKVAGDKISGRRKFQGLGFEVPGNFAKGEDLKPLT